MSTAAPHSASILINNFNQTLLQQIQKKQRRMFELFASKTKREFLDPSKISPHLRCSICQDIFEDPVRTACGHTYCYICIENWARIIQACPLCKRSIRKRKLEKDLIAFNIIDDLPAKCIHLSCNWTGVYSIVKKHQRECEFKPKRNLQQINSENVQVVQINNEESYGERIEVVNLESESESEMIDIDKSPPLR